MSEEPSVTTAAGTARGVRSSPTDSAREGRAPRASVLLAVVLSLTALVYSKALSGPFLWDDHTLIEREAVVIELQPNSFSLFCSCSRLLENFSDSVCAATPTEVAPNTCSATNAPI